MSLFEITKRKKRQVCNNKPECVGQVACWAVVDTV